MSFSIMSLAAMTNYLIANTCCLIVYNQPYALQGATEKSGPLNFFTVFSATVWDFNTKFYSFIY